jgi:hypothetical protein
MGRPINKKYIGNTSQSGQQIQATAWIPGAAEPALAYISKQTATNTYKMTTEDGQYTGIVQLTQGGTALQQGQANITVTPYGATGSGAVASARMKAFDATIGTSGTGAVTADYDIGDTVNVLGGTNTAIASFTVSGIVVGQTGLSSGGSNYNAGNQITFGGAGWVSNVVLSVATVSATGAITSFAQNAGGGIRSGAALATLSGGTTLIGSSGNADTSGTGATFTVRWGVANVTVASQGVFSALPSNPVSTTTDGSGAGATLNVRWKVSNVAVSNGGTDFDEFATVTFASGTAAATPTVNAAGSISSVTVTNPGDPVTAIPGVTIAPGNNVQYAQEIRNLSVWTFDNNTFEWVMSDIDLTQSNQARIQSA